MPLVILTGFPCSGKSKRSKDIETYFKIEKGKEVHIVSDNNVIGSTNITKSDLCFNAQKEKEIRSILKSETLRLLGRENVVILDAANYIKGYRYELYCASKNSKTTQVTVECVVNQEQAWQWNQGLAEDQQYTREAFDALIMRYEAPDSRNRWDSPLVALQSEDPTPNEVLDEALFQRKPPPPNQSTQSAPLSSTNFLYELDRVTQEIVASILSAQKLGISDEVKIPGFSDCVVSMPGSPLSPAQLARHRRQFLAYTRLNPPASPQQSAHQLAHMFVQFLNTTLAGAH
uniref:Protein KTI12 homolog n=1 Tax=Graphocephala atropunctata TaxID=36148 RepID=A0A1B6L1A0_9HEMI